MTTTTGRATPDRGVPDGPEAVVVQPLDLLVARRLCALLEADDAAVIAAAALAVAAPRGGHVCVDLVDVVGPVVGPSGEVVHGPDGDPVGWAARVAASPVGRRGDGPDDARPIVVDGTRCYLDRYWRYETRLRDGLLARCDVRAAIEPADVRLLVEAVAPRRVDAPTDEVDHQRLAVATSLLHPLTVVTGGPGTGKTHTLVSIVAAHLLRAAALGNRPPRVLLAAPTGKAAARMEEAVRDAIASRDLPEDVTDIIAAVRGSTVHRVLGTQPWAPTRFRHDADDPVQADLVVVDEASMVPLSLMAKLVGAIAPDATLVLVGDRDQLTSVEAGAVLGDVSGPRGGGSARSAAATGRLVAATGEPLVAGTAARKAGGIADVLVELDRFHRFGDDSGIADLARDVQRVTTDPAAVLDRLGDGGYAGVAWHRPTAAGLPPALRTEVVDAMSPLLEAARDGDAATALTRLDDLRLLCARRRGPLGVEAVGDTVEAWLSAALPWLRAEDEEWFVGRPIMVTRNDHDLRLMNGDVGVTIERDGHRVVAFPAPGGEVRHVPAVRVGDVATTWALTIHKSQGSQFDHAVVVLPRRGDGGLSRELVYTGVTRARRRVSLVAEPGRLGHALVTPVRRASGLGDRLWSDLAPPGS